MNCFTDNDCQSQSDSSVVSKCKCSYSADGQSFCDLHQGDEEWQEAIIAFKIYYNQTKGCHATQRWGECNQKKLFYDW